MTRTLLLLFAGVLLAGTLHAQELPFKPLPTVRVHMTDGTKKWWEPLPVRQPTADAHYWERFAASQAVTVGDIENSMYALRKPGTIEKSPIYGSHPSRAVYYPIAEAVALTCAYWDWRYTREDNALKDAGLPGHRFVKGWLPTAMNTGAHLFGIIYTLTATGR